MEYNNVYTFFGSDSKVGTTMIVSALAEKLSIVNKVLVINANKRIGLDYFKEAEANGYLEDLQNKLDSSILEYEDIEKISIKKDNLHIIPGIRDIEKCRYFKPEDIEQIFAVSHEKYDVILVDAGSEFEYSGLSLGSLERSKNNVLVTTQQEKSWIELKRVIDISERAKIKYHNLVINKKQPKSAAVIDEETIKNYVGIEDNIFDVNNSPYSWQAESDYKTLVGFDKDFEKDIDSLSKHVSMVLSLRVPEEKKSKFKFFKK